MSDDENLTASQRRKINGTVVSKALKRLNKPATLQTIVAHIAEQTQRNRADIAQAVREALRHGLDLGFVDRLNSRYYCLTHAARAMARKLAAASKKRAESRTSTTTTVSLSGVWEGCGACGGAAGSAQHHRHTAAKRKGKGKSGGGKVKTPRKGRKGRKGR